MCGIFGAVTAHGKPIDPDLALHQLTTLTHRGPDGYGVLLAHTETGRVAVTYNRPPRDGAGLFDVVLGHRRLSILDLSAAASQPMGDAAGRRWITFNGEIYNFQALRQELRARGHTFQTDHADTEVLLHAFMEWGEGCLDRLRGMFAFAVLDLEAGRLFLARDRLGKKPLYYRASSEGFQFASELKALVADPRTPRRLDPVALAQYLMYNYIPAPRTIYDGIQKLPAAHCAWVDLGRPATVGARAYWRLRYAPTDGRRLEDWTEEFEAEFAEAVRLRMLSDVPLGALLSGGLDSTAVVRAMSRLSPRPVKTFTIGFDEAGYSELAWARRVARRYGTEHFEEIVRPDALALLPRLAAQYDEPFADASALPTYCVTRMARGHVTVALSGDGGDELFAGYNRYDRIRALSRLDWLPLLLRRAVFGTAARLWPEHLAGKGALTLLGSDPDRRYLEERAKSSACRFLAPDVRGAVLRNGQLHAGFAAAWASGPSDVVSRLQYVDSRTYLPEDILVKLDRASMGNSLEARCPFLDHRVVELAATMPVDVKYREGDKKVLLKRLLVPDLGLDFVSRPKKGFGVPRNLWFRGQLSGHVRERLTASGRDLPDAISRPEVERLVRAYQRGNRDLSRYVWNLLMLSEWTRVYGRADVRV